MRLRWAASAIALILSNAASAYAQPSDADRALATELFKQGRALMSEKKHADACPKFEQSQRLDPGGGTLLNLALCHEAAGKLATARTEFEEAAAIAQRDNRPDREKLAKEHASAIEPRLMRLVVQVPQASDVPGLVIKRGTVAIPRAAWGTPMPLDPGDYTIEATAPERSSWMTMVRLSVEGTQLEVTVPGLTELPVPPPSQPVAPVPIVPLPQQPLVAPRPMPSAPAPIDRTPWYVAGGVMSGVAAIGLIAGGISGGLAAARKASLDERCGGGEPRQCGPEDAGTIIDMQTFAKASTGLLVVGGLFAAGGVSLLAVGATLDDTDLRIGAALTEPALVVQVGF